MPTSVLKCESALIAAISVMSSTVHVCRGGGQKLYLTFFEVRHRGQKFPPGQGQVLAAVERIGAAGMASALPVQVRTSHFTELFCPSSLPSL